MARPIKQGLDYFPFDVDFFEDDKISFVSARFQEKGELIAIKLLCKIYKDNGYYYQWGEDEAVLFAKRVVGDASRHTLVNDVVQELIKRGFFDKSIFDRFKILTSRGIQVRYLQAISERKKIEITKEYWLVELPKSGLNIVNRPINEVNPPINPINRPGSTQSKPKETKVKKSKVGKDDFLTKIITAFQDSYFDIFQIDYSILSEGKERAAASKLLETYKGKYPNSTSEETILGLNAFFRECCTINDAWLRQNMSLSIIVSKFNEIKNHIKNGDKKNRSVASRGSEIDAIIDAVFDSKGLQ